MKKRLWTKNLILFFILIPIIIFIYLSNNKSKYKQSEVKQTLRALALAEENYHQQFRKYTDREEDLGVNFSDLSNLSVYLTSESLPKNIKLSHEHLPNVGTDFYRVIVVFKDSKSHLHIWKLENGKEVKLY